MLAFSLLHGRAEELASCCMVVYSSLSCCSLRLRHPMYANGRAGRSQMMSALPPSKNAEMAVT